MTTYEMTDADKACVELVRDLTNESDDEASNQTMADGFESYIRRARAILKPKDPRDAVVDAAIAWTRVPSEMYYDAIARGKVIDAVNRYLAAQKGGE